jgi:hypothetical protein
MSKRVAIIQSSYIPWKGYFDIINMVDEFILYDDAEYSKGDWRNRNKIKTAQGLKWLTIPVRVRGRSHQKVKDTRIASKNWNRKHWHTISCSGYANAPYFDKYKGLFENLYMECKENYLSEVNYKFIKSICKVLDINSQISWSMDYEIKSDDSTKKIIDLCKQVEAEEYISGPSARNYIKEELFEESNIKLKYMDYSSYPEYDQLFGPFEHHVSIIDLIFNVGPNAHSYMKSF